MLKWSKCIKLEAEAWWIRNPRRWDLRVLFGPYRLRRRSPQWISSRSVSRLYNGSARRWRRQRMIWAVDTGGNLGVSPVADGRWPDVMWDCTLALWHACPLGLVSLMQHRIHVASCRYMWPWEWREWREYAEKGVSENPMSAQLD